MVKIHKLFAITFSVALLAACSDSVEDIESSNQYNWQRHMNENEFEQLKEGMTYMDVVKVARGGGEKKEEGTYVWHDENVMTVAYEVTFQEDKLTKKETIAILGHSKRDLKDEKEPAKPE